MQENSICPYPGLRPFNEDEAIFFKGRDEHIEQIVKQLEEKKFLMLTGASGDGKSSLVYAGLIPNARAGFFKAKYNNWIVADFRPEREPLGNMAQAINHQLKVNDLQKVEKELGFGFSALIDLYKKSNYWIDQQTEAFTNLSVDEQKKAKRKGANLLILVDQFEEFFTNPENYSNGKTSLDSQAVVNLLLETSRLAIEQDLPIYIICTMRSDYIGQCASFRGLPEYIGYSQFFVPRLKRKEIYQVIEEPALLNGNKISKRLIEMLLNEMNDGIDQLPVLQHALNQIWQKADKGKAEMDLIHFAKINGIPKNHLTQKDQLEFENWFDTLPEFKKKFFANSSLGDVLDAHANELYETANHSFESEVTLEQAKIIVETTFKCLTKIDEARSVRNRMLLEEVTQIINRPDISTALVAKVLHVYRIQGTTFLRPFIEENDHSDELSTNTVLDITHESLIRNWNLLTNWAKEEHESFLTWQDFNKQLQRWLKSEKSSGYLLPIGPLTFFENWYNTAKPNKYWLARYDEREISKSEKIAEAEETIKNAKQFIKRSANRLFFSRTVLKYGADKLIAVFGALLLIFGCTYFYFDFRQKQNDYVIKQIQEKSIDLLKSKYVKNEIKANYLLIAERLHPGEYENFLSLIPEDTSKLEIVRRNFGTCYYYQQELKLNEPDNPLLDKLFKIQLDYVNKNKAFSSNQLFIKNARNIIGVACSYAALKNINRHKLHLLEFETFCKNYFQSFCKLLDDEKNLTSLDIGTFNTMLQTTIYITNLDSLKLATITNKISPFNVVGKKTFDIIYSKDKELQNNNDKISHNGGYYELCSFYALLKNYPFLNKSFDSLSKYNKNFPSSGWGYTYINLTIDLFLSKSILQKETKEFLNRVQNSLKDKVNFPLTVLALNDLFESPVSMSGWNVSDLSRQKISGNNYCFEKELISKEDLKKLSAQLFEEYENENPKVNVPETAYDSLGNEITYYGENRNKNELNFRLALLYKARAFYFNKKDNYSPAEIKENLEKAFKYYKKISDPFLKETIDIGRSYDLKTVIRNKLFIYPISVSLEYIYNEDNASYYLNQIKNKTVFIDFITDKKNNLSLEKIFFTDAKDIETFNTYLTICCSNSIWSDSTKIFFNPQTLETLVNDKKLYTKIDRNLLLAYLTLFNHHAKKNIEAKKFANQIDFQQLLNKDKISKNALSGHHYQIATSLVNYFLNTHESANTSLSSKGDNYTKAFKLLNFFPEHFQKRNALLMNIDSLMTGDHFELAISLLDSLVNKEISKSNKFGNKLFEILGKLSSSQMDFLAKKLMKDKSDKVKPNCLELFVNGKAIKGNYYQAIRFIPDYISSMSQFKLYSNILKIELEKTTKLNPNGWSSMDEKINYNLGNSWWFDTPFETGETDVIFSMEE